MCAQSSPIRVLALALGLFAGLGPALSAAEEAGAFQPSVDGGVGRSLPVDGPAGG